MRKTMAILLIGVFVVALAVAFMFSAVTAKPPVPNPCTYKCINCVGYKCCIVNGQEVCTYEPKIDCYCPPD